MRITSRQLRQIIKEELTRSMLREGFTGDLTSMASSLRSALNDREASRLSSMGDDRAAAVGALRGGEANVAKVTATSGKGGPCIMVTATGRNMGLVRLSSSNSVKEIPGKTYMFDTEKDLKDFVETATGGQVASMDVELDMSSSDTDIGKNVFGYAIYFR